MRKRKIFENIRLQSIWRLEPSAETVFSQLLPNVQIFSVINQYLFDDDEEVGQISGGFEGARGASDPAA
jgi:hypothetical protein